MTWYLHILGHTLMHGTNYLSNRGYFRLFQATQGEVAYVNSLLAGFYLLAGPFVSALANKYGFRVVTIIGSIIGSAAFAISYFATSVEYLYLSYGILGGKSGSILAAILAIF